MRRLLPILAALAFALPAQAAEEKAEKTAAGQYVDLAPVALPIVVRGALVNYVFVYVRINLKNGADVMKVREKEPFFRDALIRAAHRTPFTDPKDYTVVDVARVQATVVKEASAIAGAAAIKSAVVTSQSPKTRLRLPKPQVAAKS